MLLLCVFKYDEDIVLGAMGERGVYSAGGTSQLRPSQN
jgi:hypothetical protein